MSTTLVTARRLSPAPASAGAGAACCGPDTAATLSQVSVKEPVNCTPAPTTRRARTRPLVAAGAFRPHLPAPQKCNLLGYTLGDAPERRFAVCNVLRYKTAAAVAALLALTLAGFASVSPAPNLTAPAPIPHPNAPIPNQPDAPASAVIPAGSYVPLQRSVKDLARVPVAAFRLDVTPVTNAQFLAFVRAHPKWQRSRVSPLFADASYLETWAGDLELGPRAPADAPVVRVSWFAARAYAAWVGKRLPTTAEWELAASAGYTRADGKNDEQLNRDLYAWLARPVPAVLPNVSTARANFHGVRGLHGLVWEWVSDFNTALVTGESRADSGLERDLFCGAGSVGAKDTTDYAAFMRGALRASLKANNTTSSLGFRCAQDL